jgi:excinuclease ABC subunit A
VCKGKRFRREVLDVAYHGKTIADVLGMTVAEAIGFFGARPDGRKLAAKLRVLDEVGLGYVRLGQSSSTLSGGEAQRVKLAAHLTAPERGGHTLFVFDEPTTGLHFDDIRKLLACFTALIGAGHSVVLIEHHPDVIKCADWVIDLGPEAGDGGGRIVAEGTPEQIASAAGSHTGANLRPYLSGGTTAGG